jgi:hypothetical protein
MDSSALTRLRLLNSMSSDNRSYNAAQNLLCCFCNQACGDIVDPNNVDTEYVITNTTVNNLIVLTSSSQTIYSATTLASL